MSGVPGAPKAFTRPYRGIISVRKFAAKPFSLFSKREEAIPLLYKVKLDLWMDNIKVTTRPRKIAFKFLMIRGTNE